MSIESLVEKSIDKKSQCYRFFTSLAEISFEPEIKSILEELAQEEIEHRELLEAIKREAREADTAGNFEHLKDHDFLSSEPVNSDAEIEEILKFSIIKSNFAYHFFKELEKYSTSEDLKQVFKKIAILNWP